MNNSDIFDDHSQLGVATVRRLAFIRYIYKTAIDQALQPTPLNSASILGMHDAIELFLQLATEKLNASRSEKFMEYWDHINAKLPQELQQRESIRRLNAARVSLKHQGTLPSEVDISSFRSSTIDFFAQNSYLVFGVDFERISLIDFVSYAPSRNALIEAERNQRECNLQAALRNCAEAFHGLLVDYESRKSRFGRSPYSFGNSWLNSQSNILMSDSYRDLRPLVKPLVASIEDMRSSLKIIALGIDFKKYAKFEELTPRGMLMADGIWRAFPDDTDENISDEDVAFCINFVVESAIAMSQFDYTIL